MGLLLVRALLLVFVLTWKPSSKGFKVNIEVNHATLAGHTFEHELTVAVDNGFLGSIDANRGDAQNGWDTDQFPVDAYDLTQAMMQIIRNGGFKDGGTNFDAKLRRSSTDLEDLFIAHISAMDAMAHALLNAAAVLEESPICEMVSKRYASFQARCRTRKTDTDDLKPQSR